MTRQSNSGDSGDYDVGYGKPPRGTQFKPGVSGNPQGRRRKSKEAELPFDLFQRIFNQKTRIRVDGKVRELPLREVAVQQLAAKAATGDASSIKEMIKIETMIEKLERERRGPEQAPFEFNVWLTDEGLLRALEALEIVEADHGAQRLHPRIVEWARANKNLPEATRTLVEQASFFKRDRYKPRSSGP
jgi:hypothetical protein